ncbi:mitochondrial genome maintenance MGM101-domain-containing protein [Podospora australis]|uniref:Mitochondrial genome maintenance protein MGM101 n=1 Tax=Podospora australis TaxID=1536484 RepID=A0AAN6WQT3_9PEZI|nr:mitochondrial genome maintenance MGM101-domain-containing protein [Podospora australis]
MRSSTLQACRPLRAVSSSLQCLSSPNPRATALLRPAIVASTTIPSRSATTSSSTSSSTTPRSSYYSKTSTTRVTPKTTASSAAAKKATATSTETSTPPVDRTGEVLDPQAATLEPATVADVDPSLAASIPAPGGSGSSAPSPAFTAAISGQQNGNTPEGPAGNGIDWSSSFHGLSTTPFTPETAAVLMKPLDPLDVEIKPDGIIYLPEIKYRRILNLAFGPGAWGLAPRGELVVGEKVVTREYALVVHGRFVAQARGECQYFSEDTIPTAGEGCKSNALMRCCKDIGIASELWDPRFIREFKKKYCQEVWVEHVVTKKRRQTWIRKDGEPAYPFVLAKSTYAKST